LSSIEIKILSLEALLFTGTTLWARIAIQGVELALLSTAIEGCLNGIRAGTRLLRQHRQLCFVGKYQSTINNLRWLCHNP